MSRLGLRVQGILGAGVISMIGCNDVPILTFPGADAGADGVDAGADASDTAADSPGAPSDSSDGPEASASPDVGCPSQPPAGASACCGSVPCKGDCDAHCLECQVKCGSPAQVCCAKTTATCHAPTFVCN